MKRLVALCINGHNHTLALEPQVTLLEALRENLQLTGTKEACGMGECGSCTVLLDGKAILACLILAADCQGRDITTIEGLARNGSLSLVQNAFHEAGAVQCGFCTPGMVLSTYALLEDNPCPSEAEIKKALEGNLCRCTGYNKIMEAVQRAAQAMPRRKG